MTKTTRPSILGAIAAALGGTARYAFAQAMPKLKAKPSYPGFCAGKGEAERRLRQIAAGRLTMAGTEEARHAQLLRKAA